MSERERTQEGENRAAEERPAGVKRVETELLNGELDLEREANRLKEMGEPTRFTIMYLLTQEGRIASGELADALDRHQNDLYHHLDRLEDAGLVSKYRSKSSRAYELSPLAETLVRPVFAAIRERAEAV